MKQLQNLLADRLKAGLARSSVTNASRWAEEYRVMGGGSFPGPWKFDNHPWLRAMHESKSWFNVGQKSAQMGYTEAMLNVVFYHIDVKHVDCLYLLPASKPDASDFSASRFDPALEASSHLAKIFSDVKNLGHKRAGSTNLYIRGSRSKSGLKSIPVGFIAFDEVDEMDQENIPLAMERTSGQLEKLIWMISTPRIDNIGINKYYRMTTQEHFFFKCPSCSRRIELTFPDSLVVCGNDVLDPDVNKSYYQCTACKAKLEHQDKKRFLALHNGSDWVPTAPGPEARGFHINQMYSPAAAGKPSEIALAYLKSLRDPTEEQEFFNSKLGLTHVVDGAKVDLAMIMECIAGHTRMKSFEGNQFITMGVDVGKFLHCEINAWNIPTGAPANDLAAHAVPRVIWYGKLAAFEDLDMLMNKFRVNYCVVDANPERRKAYEFSMRFYGRVKLCFYSKGQSGRIISASKEVDQAILVDRTSWLDLSLGRFKKGKKGILLPVDLDLEYKDHMQALVRIYEKDADGNPIGKYVNGAIADHYAHSRNYAEIALPLAVGIGITHNVDVGV
jgi:hypothetical protein